MPRRRVAAKREIIPDPKFGSARLAKFINHVMESGKKAVAERIVYGALDIVADKSKEEPIDMFEKALENIQPMVEVKSRRVGGATYQVPSELRVNRSEALATRWIIHSARARQGMPMVRKLAAELLDAARGDGAAVRRKEELHRMADANRAFVHYKW